MKNTKRISGAVFWGLIVGYFLFFSYSPAASETIDEVYKKALKEEGVLNCYCSIAQINAEKFFPIFERRFPGIKINQVDATADKLVARAVTEARGGKTLGDVFNTNLENVGQMHDQGLLLEKLPPEEAEYPEGLKGTYWVATDLQFIIAAWNTTLVKKEEEPKQFEDFADPRWKSRLIAEPRDLELLLGLAKYKFKSDEKAIALLKKIAANNVEFHKGHSQLAELLVAGQAAVCITCYAHHYPPRMKKGAPVNMMLTEGMANIQAGSIFKNAPHPNTAMLFARWISSQEGQKAMAIGGRTPAHPKIEPTEKMRPGKIYALVVADYKEFPKYEKIWKEIFKLR
jgi:iron(III) transport system substrate-binding protein